MSRDIDIRIYEWKPKLSLKEQKDGAYWERNMLALRYADGWYNDDIEERCEYTYAMRKKPRFDAWRRVLSLDSGAITFHIPDDFPVGDLPEIEPNWDGHTTREKWLRIMKSKSIEVPSDD